VSLAQKKKKKKKTRTCVQSVISIFFNWLYLYDNEKMRMLKIVYLAFVGWSDFHWFYE